jgi:hypothetical protein
VGEGQGPRRFLSSLDRTPRRRGGWLAFERTSGFEGVVFARSSSGKVGRAVGRSGIGVSETLELRRVTIGQVGEVVASEFAAGGYESSEITVNTLQFSRVFRPRWALVSGCIFTIVGLGTGLWLFLIKRTETCLVVISDDQAMVKVTVTGQLLASVLEELRAALQRVDCSASGGAVACVDAGLIAPPVAGVVEFPGSVSIPDSVIDLRGGAIAERERTVDRPQAVPSALLAAVRFDDGETIIVDRLIVVGRDPSSTAFADGPVLRIAIGDPTSTVSKTHFLMGTNGAGLWIEDLHSTNGTAVGTHPATARELVPGERVAIAPGDVIWFGDRRADVVASDAVRPQGSAPHSR